MAAEDAGTGAEAGAVDAAVPEDAQVEDSSTGVDVTPANTPPGAPTIHIEPAGPTTQHELTCVIDVDSVDVDGDAVTYVFSWSDGIEVVTGATLPGSSTASGETWVCTVTPNDGVADGQIATASTTIQNTPPGAPTIHIEPSDPTTVADLTCVVDLDAEDVDGDLITYDYEWTNGTAVLSGATVPYASTAKGETWVCVVTPNDGTDDGPVASASVTVVNTAPTAPGLAVTPDPPVASSDLLCAVAVPSLDADGDSVSYAFTWVHDSTVISGATLLATQTEQDQTWQCVVTPHDGKVAGAVATITVVIGNSPPTAPVVAVAPALPTTTDSVTCAVSTPSTDADGDDVTYNYRWSTDGISINNAVLQAAFTAKGQVWVCTVTPSDGKVDGAAGTAGVTIQNTAPGAPVVGITPANPRTADDLVCAVTTVSTDIDGDAVTYSYLWTTTGKSHSGATLPAAQTAKGETWTCTVTPSDGTATGPTGQASTTILNTAPTAPVVAVNPASPRTTDNLTCSVTTASADADGDSVSYSFAWSSGAKSYTGAILPAAQTQKGETWTCAVTPGDGTDSGSAGTASRTIVNSAPGPATIEITPPEPHTTDNLHCGVAVAATDADGDAVTYAYAWRVNGLDAGITTPDVASALTARDESWECTVIASDGELDGAAVTANTVILNTVPTAPVVAISPATAYTTNNLSCTVTTASSDADGDSVTYAFAWTSNTSETYSGATLPASKTAKGETWTCTVTPRSDGQPGPAGSAARTILNTAPTAPVVGITPATAYTTNTLTCAVTTASTDADGDTVTYSYAWASGAKTYPGATLPASETVKNETWTCTVTPNDGTANGPTGQASTTILNSLPTQPVVGISPATAYTTSTLTCAVTTASTDADGDLVTYEFAWTSNTSETYSGATLPASKTAKGETWTCTVTPRSDGQPGPAGSAARTILNTAPTAPVVGITPATAYTTNTLTCAVTTESTDADGDTVTYSYAWASGAKTYPGATLPASETVKGETWTCTVTPNDSTANGPTAQASRTILNSLPTQPVLGSTPANPRTADDITCTVTTVSTDADGDSLTYYGQWTTTGKTQNGGLLPAAMTVKGETWTCTAWANDGLGNGPSNTTTTTILNTPPTAPVVGITPADPASLADLTCNVTAASTDADGDSISYAYAWSNGVSGYTGQVLPHTMTADGDTWTCTITPSDGTATGPAATASETIRAATCDGACEYGIYTECSCGTGDPCGWQGDGYCDTPGDGTQCEVFASHFDDSVDCFCTGIQAWPCTSCKEIKDNVPAAIDGEYWIDPTGSSPFKVYCDMNTDGGGWTLVYSNLYNRGNPVHADDFLSTSATYDVEYNTTGYTNSAGRRLLPFSEMMFLYAVHDPDETATPTRSIYSHTAASILDMQNGEQLTYVAAKSTGPLPLNVAGAGGMGTYSSTTMYFHKTGADHRNYAFSQYDTDNWNQAGLFCWSGPYCDNTLFADLDAPLGTLNQNGYAEIYVRSNCGEIRAQLPSDTNYNTFEYNGHLYATSTYSVAWDEARRACDGLCGYLLVVDDQAEREAVFAAIGGPGWIGYEDIDGDGEFTWVNGSSSTYTYFCNYPTPNGCANPGPGSGQCVASGQYWYKYVCDTDVGFTCEIP